MNQMEAGIRNRILSLAQRLLLAVEPLVNGPIKYSDDEDYSQFIEGLFRKAYFSFRCIVKLIETEEDVITAGPLIDLQRGLLEDTVTIEWVKLTDPKEYARKFWLYQAQEIQDEVTTIEKAGRKPKQDLLKKLCETMPVAERRLGVDDRGRLLPWRSVNMMQMIEDLSKSGLIKRDSEKELIKWSWRAGNQQNHPTPNGVIHYVLTDRLESWSKTSVEHALVTGVSYFSRIALSLPEWEGELALQAKTEIEAIRKELFSKSFGKTGG